MNRYALFDKENNILMDSLGDQTNVFLFELLFPGEIFNLMKESTEIKTISFTVEGMNQLEESKDSNFINYNVEPKNNGFIRHVFEYDSEKCIFEYNFTEKSYGDIIYYICVLTRKKD